MASERVALPGGVATVQWRRSRRARTVSLRIDPSCGEVVVILPPRCRRNAGMALLIEHSTWVLDRLAALAPASPFVDGATVRLNGCDHLVRHQPTAPDHAWLVGREIHVGGAAAHIGPNLSAFLYCEAQRRLSSLVAAKAALIKADARRVQVKDTTSRWGSCAADGSIAFNWRLVMAPPFVQDYAASHETAHLRNMNHGAAFWADVDDLTPHRAAATAWLKREGAALLRQGVSLDPPTRLTRSLAGGANRRIDASH